MMRVTVCLEGKKERIIERSEPVSYYRILREEGILLPSSCGGHGICGKCRIKFLSEAPLPTELERQFFSKEELEAGNRLSCVCGHMENAVISLEELDESTMEILGTDARGSQLEKQKKETSFQYAIAVDIGTTTIAMALFDSRTGEVWDDESCVNHGRSFGADVLARISAANEGHGEALKEILRQDIRQGIRKLIQRNKIEKSKLKQIYLAGNTTMQHLLLGYSCEKLGCFPFQPVQLIPEEQSYEQLFGEEGIPAMVNFMPGISAFIGGDIIMGVYESGMAEREELSILIDLGTNGEMVLGNRQKMLACSVAAGPAFEGGNIEKGMAGIAGAISHVVIEENRVRYETIGKKTPIGICGTGVLETIAELLRTGKIDDKGTFTEKTEKYDILSGIYISQKDIRQIQLAKAAIRAGIELLIEEYGGKKDEISAVYLSGGFGCQLEEAVAFSLGILPEEWRGRFKQLGNSSLKGTIRYGSTPLASEQIKKIRENIQEQNLAMHPKFQEFYIKYMDFS